MKTTPAAGAAFREVRVFRQKPVAWVNCLSAGFLGRLNDFGAVEIARAGRRRTYPKSLVGKRDMHRRAIGVRIDGGARNAKPPGCPDDPAGDLPAIGDQDFRKHRVSYHTLTPRRTPRHRSRVPWRKLLELEGGVEVTP